MKLKLLLLTALIILAIILVGVPRAVQAQSISSFVLYPGGNEPDGVSAGQSTYNIFYDSTFSFPYPGGPAVCLSSQSDNCVPTAIDDYVIIYVNGNKVVDQRSYTQDFGSIDFTPFLQIGNNQIHVQLIDLGGPSRGGSALWLVSSGARCIGPCSNDQQPAAPLQSSDTGACPGFSLTGETYDVEMNQDGVGWMRESPSFSGTIIRRRPLNASGFNTTKWACSEGYTWEYDTDMDDPSISGWVAVAHVVPGTTPVVPTESAQSVPVPVQPSNLVSALPPDGPRSPSGFWCFLPGLCVQAAGTNTTCHPQCVETANSLRPDLPIWGAVMTSDQILAVAQSEPRFTWKNDAQQVRVRGSNESPQAGDLVIWPSNCDYAWSGGGHIGYVTNGNPLRITDSNWNGACGDRTNQKIDVQSCMRFITQPYPLLQPDFGPPRGATPSATSNGGFLDWLKKIFGGK